VPVTGRPVAVVAEFVGHDAATSATPLVGTATGDCSTLPDGVPVGAGVAGAAQPLNTRSSKEVALTTMDDFVAFRAFEGVFRYVTGPSADRRNVPDLPVEMWTGPTFWLNRGPAAS
jgi:hypothetical protein